MRGSFRFGATWTACVAVLVLAGCGGGGGGSSDPGTDAADVHQPDPGGEPDVTDVPDPGTDPGTDTSDVGVDTFTPLCTPATVEDDCATECAAADQCHECRCNVAIAGGTCEVVPKPDETACDDSEACTVGEQCMSGVCGGGRAICDCAETADCAGFEDDDLCNGTLVCDLENFPYACVIDPDTVVACDDGEDTFCAENRCDPQTGVCGMVGVNEDVICEDGDLCTIETRCVAGECAVIEALDCDDGNPCTDDSCDSELGCIRVANSAPCEDGNPCTVDDICIARQCIGGSPRNCDDGLFCNGVETCDPTQGCVAGVAPICDDGIACTLDSCDDALGCLHEWDPGAVEGPYLALSCTNGLDDDCDGLTDGDDPECAFRLDAVDPSNGPYTGGTVVILSGGSLDLVLAVRVDGVLVDFERLSDDELRVVMPAHAEGDVDLSIHAEAVAYTLPNAFRYTGLAELEGVFALEGPADPHEMVQGETSPVYAATAFVEDVTDVAEPDPQVIRAQIGYGLHGTNPAVDPSWRWEDAPWAGTDGTRFRFETDLTPAVGGYYEVAARFSMNQGFSFLYADLDGADNGVASETMPDLTVWGVPRPGEVVINELMWPGSEEDVNDEWIELRNMTQAPIWLHGWRISGAGYPQGADFVFDAPERVVNNLLLEPHGYFLLAQFPTAGSSVRVPVDVVAQATGGALRLMRLTDTVTPWTYNLIDGEGTVLDTAVFTGRVGLNGFANPLRQSSSMERGKLPGDGSLDASWHTAFVADGWDSDPRQDGNRGTPRGPNSDMPQCLLDAECEDLWPDLEIGECEALVCAVGIGRCATVRLDDGTPCSNGVFCTDGETCTAGTCGGGAPRDCADSGLQADCTVDWCDEDARECVHEWAEDAFEGPGGHGTCSDGIDNDCDGLTDGADPQCGLFLYSADPVAVPMDGGWQLAVTGANLDLVTVVALGDQIADFRDVTATTMTVIVPVMPAPGDYVLSAGDGVVRAELEATIRVFGPADDVAAGIVSPTGPMQVYPGQTTPVIRARVFVEGITNADPPVDPSLLIAEIGIGPDPSDPFADREWTWLPATQVACEGCEDHFQYEAVLVAGAPGQYLVVYRFSADDGYTFQYAHIGPPTYDPFQLAQALTLFVEEVGP